MMSVTMLLRRSPDLDVSNLGHLNLISSTTLGQPIPPRSRSTSPQRIVSNNSSPVNAEPMAARATRMGRSPVVPHAIHLRSLQSCSVPGVVDSLDAAHRRHHDAHEEMHKSRVWHSARHSLSPEHTVQDTAQKTQRRSTGMQSLAEGKFSSSPHAKYGNSPQSHAQLDFSPEEAAFDLYHHSQKLAMQLSAGTEQHISHHEAATAAATAMQGRPLPDSRASSISPASAVAPGASSIQGPALDTDAVAADASTDSAGGLRSFSMQPSDQNTDLMRKSSTVRFATPDPEADLSLNPRTDTVAAAGRFAERSGDNALLASHHDSGSLADGGTFGKLKPTLSMSSATSSLRSVLKKTANSNSAAMLSHDSGRVLDSSGVSFALSPDAHANANQRPLDNDAGSLSPQTNGLQKQASESFPSWLVGG